MTMIFDEREVKGILSSKPKERTEVITNPKTLRAMIEKETRCFYKDKKGKVSSTSAYHDVWLLETTNRFIWRNSTRDWKHMVLKFYFPKRQEIRHVLISKCLACFTKPQICNIVSRAKAWAVEKDIDLVRLQMPAFTRNFIYCGVGAALHEATTTERDPAAALSGPIYHNPQYQQTL